MSNLDSMLERNKDFAAQQSAAGTLMPSLPDATPNLKAMIIGCADMRVDPAHLLGLKPGEALVLRNIGGRITPVLLEELGMLGRVGQVMGKVAGVAGNFTSSFFITPTAASLALRATLPCWRTIFK